MRSGEVAPRRPAARPAATYRRRATPRAAAQSASVASVGERDAAGDLGEQALAVADDGRRAPVEVGPALAQQGEGDGVERAGLDVVAHARCGGGAGAARRPPRA